MTAPRRAIFAAAVLAVAGCNFNKNDRAANRMEPPIDPKSVKVAPEPEINFDTRLAAGKLAESRGDWERAAEQYQKALHLRPNDPRALHELGVALTVLKRYDEAIQIWQRTIDLTNGSCDAWNNIGQCYEYAGKSREAEHAYRTAIAMDPKSAIARTNYGLMLVRAGRVDEGRQQMSLVMSEAEVHYNVASVLESQGNLTLAKAEYVQALKADPRMEDARKRLAKIE